MNTRLNDQTRILVVSYTFPPVAEVGSIRIAQLCGYLQEQGIEPIVLTVQDQFYEVVDRSRTPPASMKIVRTGMISTPMTWYTNARHIFKTSACKETSEHNVSEVDGKQHSSRFRENMLGLLQIPDRRWGWYLPAIRQAEKLLLHEHVDAILSSGPPWTSHMVARHLKEKFGLPWVVDFRDPWASFSPVRTLPRWTYLLAKRMEGSCIRKSDLVLCNTDRLCHAFQLRYAELNPAKFQTLTNGFGDLLVPRIEKVHPKRLLLHLGSIYAHRRIDTFLAALVRLVRSGRLDAESFRVVFQGDIDPLFLAEAAQIAPDLLQSKCIQFRDRVSWKQAWELLWEADLLLLFQGSHELQVPAKFYEYLQTGIPILAITDQGALTDVLQATESGIWVNSDDPQAIADAVMQAMQQPKRSPEDISKRFSDRYHYRALAKQLSLWIRELSSGHSVGP